MAISIATISFSQSKKIKNAKPASVAKSIAPKTEKTATPIVKIIIKFCG